MELQLEELEATATEDELAAERADEHDDGSLASRARRPSRKPFPEHLPRERVVVPGPTACACCGSDRLAKLGEDVTETLEVVPRQWKVIQTVREKFTCRACESIGQPPAPFHVVPRGWAGPNLLAMILFEKYGQHQPLNRQSERYAREGVALSLSTLADQVGACAAVLQPLYEATARPCARRRAPARRRHTGAGAGARARRGPADYGPTCATTGRSRDRRRRRRCSSTRAIARGEHPERHLAGFGGILQADAYAGFNKLYDAARAWPDHRGGLLGACAGASSSSWPTSRAQGAASKLPSSRRSRSRR